MRVIDHKKTRVSRQKRVSALSVLGEVHCEQVSYDFEIPLSSFNVKAFSKTTGIKPLVRETTYDETNRIHFLYKSASY